MAISFSNRIKRKIYEGFKQNETKIHQLRYLFWECTLRCNLNCLHCGSDCTNIATVPDMPKEDFLKQAKKISLAMDPTKITVVFTGGEPLLRTDLEEVGLQLRKMGFRWGLVTNGIVYSEMRHKRLMGAGMGSLTLSIDGMEANHNWLRNSSIGFKNAENALKILVKTERLNFDVVTCVNSRNIFELDDIYQFLVKNGLKAWRLFTIAPIGRAAGNAELMLNKEHFTSLMNFISEKRPEKTLRINFSCEGYTGSYENQVRDGFFFCRAGIHIGSILIDGSVSACPNIDRGFVQGNIYESDFTEIWETRFENMRNRDWTKTGDCAKCKDWKWCKGNGLHLWNHNPLELLHCHQSHLNKPICS